jgi:GxxExxY protein
VSELIYKEETLQLVGLCMEIHRELGKGHDEVIYKDALVVELTRAGIPFSREKNYEITYKGVILPHYIMLILLCGEILLEAKAGVETSHFIDTNEGNDTNYANCHKGFERLGQFVQIARIRVSIASNSRTSRLVRVNS